MTWNRLPNTTVHSRVEPVLTGHLASANTFADVTMSNAPINSLKKAVVSPLYRSRNWDVRRCKGCGAQWYRAACRPRSIVNQCCPQIHSLCVWIPCLGCASRCRKTLTRPLCPQQLTALCGETENTTQKDYKAQEPCKIWFPLSRIII